MRLESHEWFTSAMTASVHLAEKERVVLWLVEDADIVESVAS